MAKKVNTKWTPVKQFILPSANNTCTPSIFTQWITLYEVNRRLLYNSRIKNHKALRKECLPLSLEKHLVLLKMIKIISRKWMKAGEKNCQAKRSSAVKSGVKQRPNEKSRLSRTPKWENDPKSGLLLNSTTTDYMGSRENRTVSFLNVETSSRLASLYCKPSNYLYSHWDSQFSGASLKTWETHQRFQATVNSTYFNQLKIPHFIHSPSINAWVAVNYSSYTVLVLLL